MMQAFWLISGMSLSTNSLLFKGGKKTERNMKQLSVDVSITKIILSRLTVSQDEKCVHSSASIDVLRLRTTEKKEKWGAHYMKIITTCHFEIQPIC